MHTHNDHLPNFFGRGRTQLEYDHLLVERVNPKLLKLEDELMEAKWWDYRPLHVVEATYLFIHTYSMIFKEAWARDVDVSEAQSPTLTGFKYPDQLLHTSPGELTSWWKARQAADAIGARYSIFIRSIFTHEHGKDFNAEHSYKWGRYPRPNRFYSDEMLEVAIAAWKAECEAYLQWPDSEFYHAGSNFWAKPDFDRWICKAAVERGTHWRTLPKMVENGRLTLEQIRVALSLPELSPAQLTELSLS